ncbi:hypothetical protein H0H93_013884 [Arthromyces matolae]|nr:hypothetical protein H0H93_013884 [Arthromyces matolae]
MPKHKPIKPKPGHGYPLYNPTEYEKVKDVAVKALTEYQQKFVQPPEVLPSTSASASAPAPKVPRLPKMSGSGFGVLVPGPQAPPQPPNESFQPPPTQQASAASGGSNHLQDSSTGEYQWPEFEGPSPRYL